MSAVDGQRWSGLRTAVRWLLSFAAVVAVHLGMVAAAVIWQPEPEPDMPPSAAMMLDLAPLPAAPEVPQVEEEAPRQMVQAPPPEPEVEPEPIPEPEPEPIPEPVPEPIVEPEPIPEPEAPPVEKAEVAIPPKPKARPKPPERPRPVVKRREPPKERPKEPQRKPVQEKPRDPVPNRPVAREVAAAPPALPAPPSRAPAAPAVAAPSASTAQAQASWQGLLRSHLERHKRYPRSAQLRRQEGTAHLRFRMSRAGDVLSYRLERSSSHDALDDEVLAMIQRASPLPALPPEMPGATLEIVVPVQFFIR